jgi:Flp pilus assembly protein TadG
MTNRNLQTRIRNRRAGQSMVEFALSFSLILMLMMGIFEVGRAMWSYTTVSYAARQAARYAIVHSALGATGADSSAIDDAVKSNAIGLNPDQISIVKTWTPDNSRGSQFAITVRYPVNLVGASLFLKGRDSITVGSTATYTILN